VTDDPLFLYDDERARRFEPFALTRPVSELRAGTELIRRRWERALGARAAGAIVAPHLADFTEDGAAPPAARAIPAGAIVANSRFAPSLAPTAGTAGAWTNEGQVAAVRLARETPLAAFTGGTAPLESFVPPGVRPTELDGRWIDEVWQFITTLLSTLREDIDTVGPDLSCVPAEEVTVIGPHGVFVERGATIEPQVVLDVTAGPVLVRAGAVVRAFTRLAGPCAVGAGAQILGDRVSGCAIGEMSVVRGEMSESIVLGHANKGHEGFVGHSYLGRWVNLGAGTITSNLKNTYGSVPLWTPDGVRDSGAFKLGAFFGDHVKTGIGSRFTTGSVIGAGSNVFGSTMPPRYVPPFSWGEGGALGEYRLEQFLQTAERAMARRAVTLSAGARKQLAAAHALARSGAAR
jgi:UDP-N-acetylglucosamine diphosphorylase / glucose-1-phosphate thymidylyltransferase / UDP-N-acetylgalactosamine diphosphorylase / glucosamine-1-phosphate N-acetyltransferase / galactosamine-1-phosphate N-acetyltransferase